MNTIIKIVTSKAFTVVVIILALLLALYALYRAFRYLRYLLLKKLVFTREIKDGAVFCGDSTEYKETLYNKTVLPLFFVDVESYIYRGIGIDGRNLDFSRPMQRIVSRFYVLMPFSTVERTHVLTGVKRGHYKLGSVFVYGDKKEIKIDCPCQIYVYPRLAGVPDAVPPYTNLRGDTPVRRALIADRFSYNGIRDYRPGDPFSSVNFKATAKSAYNVSALKVNTYEYTQNVKTAVLINFHVPREADIPLEKYEKMSENAVSIAASVIYGASLSGCPVAFAANCAMRGEHYLISAERTGMYGCHSILKMLAEISPSDGLSFRALIDLYIRNNTERTSFFIITPYTDAETDERISYLERFDNSVTVISPEDIPGEDAK